MHARLNKWLCPLLAAGWVGLAAPCLADDTTATIDNISKKAWTFKPMPIVRGTIHDLHKGDVWVTFFGAAARTEAFPAESPKSFTVPADSKVQLDFKAPGHKVSRRWYLLAEGQTKGTFIVGYYRKGDGKPGKLGLGAFDIDEFMAAPGNWQEKLKFKDNTLQILADGW